MGESYYLRNLNAGFVGNSPLFWAKTGGYTQWLDDAERFSKSEAEQLIKGSPGKFVMYPCDELDALAQRTVDIQKMKVAAA